MKLPDFKQVIEKVKNLSLVTVLQCIRKMSRPLLWLIFLGVTTALGFLWFYSFYQYAWSEEKKAGYRQEYSGQAAFNAERFLNTVQKFEERNRLHGEPPTVKKDIFYGASL